jgi:phosphotransferase system HPr (HPr) family protein
MYVASTKVGIQKGLHARPSAKIVELVLSKPNTYAWLEYPDGSAKAEASSMMELLMFQAYNGYDVVVKAKGEEEKDVVLSIIEILQNFKI